MGIFWTKGVTYKAVASFDGRDDLDLSFKEGDKLLLIKRYDHCWLECKNLSTQKEGMAPENFLVIDDNKVMNQIWWFDCKRPEATRLLTIPGIKRGTFLVRNCQESEKYVLSVRNFQDISDKEDVKHYFILTNKDGKVFISSSAAFKSISKLIEYYTREVGLCCMLTDACPRCPESVPFYRLQIKSELLELGECIGSGRFGMVRKALYNRKLVVAVKILMEGSFELLVEGQTQHCMRHKNLVQLMGVSYGDPKMIVLEYLKKGSLHSLLVADRGRRVKFEHLMDFAEQISCGMSYLETKDCIHKDLKTSNILISKDDVAKISDFGLSRIGNYYQGNAETLFSVQWMAIEVLEYTRFTSMSDVWSFGIVLYEMVTYGSTPYAGMVASSILDWLKEGHRLSRPTNGTCPEDLYSTMLQCWMENPNSRPTFEKLNEFFEKYCACKTSN